MSVSKIFERAAPFIALLAVLATFALVSWSIQNVQYPNSQRSERAHAAHYAEPSAETWTIQRRADGSYEAQRQTPEAHETEPKVFGVGAEGWIAIFTVVLAIATIGLIWATHSLGERADRGMRMLERAYVYPVVKTGGDLANAIEAALNFADPEDFHPIGVAVALKNFGKTAATITHVEADLYLQGSVFAATAHYPTELVLGEGDESSPLFVTFAEFNSRHAGLVLTRSGDLVMTGFVNYLDVWGDPQSEVFAWRYVHAARRLIPIHQPKSKAKRA